MLNAKSANILSKNNFKLILESKRESIEATLNETLSKAVEAGRCEIMLKNMDLLTRTILQEYGYKLDTIYSSLGNYTTVSWRDVDNC